MYHRIAAVLIAVSAVLGLTACTASSASPAETESTSRSSDQPGDEGQSTADACALIQQSIQQATEEFESAVTTDPATAAQAMTSAAERLADTASEVTNDEVAALLPALQDMFAQMGEVMGDMATGDASEVDELSRLGAEFRETSEAFQEVCSG